LGKIGKEWTEIRDEWMKIIAEIELNKEETERVETHREAIR